ncbi:MAG: NADH-quinone oxidoreductase subunit NuoH [Demequinaceae bacterium]|nr:NADH-quinone oxidoreductase subunit NuoH [Demequinaceae bacterium]
MVNIVNALVSPTPSPSVTPPEGFVPWEQTLRGDSLLLVAIKAVAILVFLLLSVLFAVWFERKVISRMQERIGPNIHGPFGLFQLVGDALKLLLKEDVSVTKRDRVLYIAAPLISVICAFLVFSVIPIGPAVRIPFTEDVTPLQLTDFPVAALFILACAAVGVYGIVLGGWASGSTYPLVGAVRSSAQIISYELAMGLSLVTVFMMSSSMYTQDIVAAQADLWFGVLLLPAFLLYIVAMVGETNRLPFDLPEAEGELVAGYMTEYSSIKFAWYFLAEYINMLNVSAVATTLFLGGWRAPWPLSAVSDGVLNTGYWPVLWFLAKVWLLMFFFVWVRGSLMRLRYDQFMRLGWKLLIPIGLGWVVLWGVARVLYVKDWLPSVKQVTVPAAIVLGLATVVVLFWPSKPGEEKTGRGRVKEIDATAGGFPVPPKPGEKLPPSPRSTRTVDARSQAKEKGDRDKG